MPLPQRNPPSPAHLHLGFQAEAGAIATLTVDPSRASSFSHTRLASACALAHPCPRAALTIPANAGRVHSIILSGRNAHAPISQLLLNSQDYFNPRDLITVRRRGSL
jgi:hypothetical protein